MERGTGARCAVLLAATLAMSSLVSDAFGQEVRPDAGQDVRTSPGLAQAQQPVDFDIPAQALSSALTAFGAQSGYQVSVDQGALSNQRSAAVSGRMTPEEALRRMLAGTGLVWRFAGARSVFLTKAPESGAISLDPVQVQGVFPVPSQAMIDNIPPPFAGGQVATGGQLGLLGNRSVMDTPFNQTSYTAKKAQDQQAVTIRDVLADDPSVRSFNADSSGAGDNMRIRGFTVSSQDTAYGGLFGMLASGSIMVEMAERVEVLKGPSAMLSGMSPFGGNIGGTINIVPKRAPDAPLTQVTAAYLSGANFGGHVDVGRRFGEDKQFGVRFNGVYRAGSTEVDGTADERALSVFGFDFRGDRLRLSADLGYQYRYLTGATPYAGVAAGIPVPWAPSARKNFGEPWNEQQYKDLFGVFRGEFDLTETITAYASFGAHDFRFGGINGGNPLVSSIYGNATATPYNNNAYFTYLTGEAGFRGLATTGPVDHQFSVSASTLSRTNGQRVTLGTAYTTNIYSPDIIARPSIPLLDVNKTNETILSSWAAADTLSAAGKRIELTAGARFQQVTQTAYNIATGAQTSNYDQSAFTPSVALVVKPFWENVSFYGNFIQGLQPGAIVSAPFANAGEVFPPYKSTQYEAGVKVDWGKLTTTVSLFQITQPSVITNVATNTQMLGGEQRNQGLEFNFFGEITEGVRVLGGVMFLEAVLTKTQGGLTDGWIAPFSPGTQFNLAGEWDLPFFPGLTVDGRVTYTGAQYFDTTLPRRTLSEWTRLDIGARYAFDNPGAPGKQLVVRFNIENLLDTNYWASANGAFLTLGNPRTFRASLTANF